MESAAQFQLENHSQTASSLVKYRIVAEDDIQIASLAYPFEGRKTQAHERI